MINNHAKYTVILKTLMDNKDGMTAIKKALSSYPLYVGEKEYDLIPTREELNTKILNHYKYREIGFDTVGRFLDELEITMCEIMPYYNERFKTVEIMANVTDPFGNVDITETFEETRSDSAKTEGSTNSNSESTNSASSNSSETGKVKFSDTPQGEIDRINDYLTTYTETNNTENISNNEESSSNGSASSNTESESTGTTRHTFTKKGNQGVNTYAHDMNEFRTSIIDVVSEIVNDKRIAELFMLIY